MNQKSDYVCVQKLIYQTAHTLECLLYFFHNIKIEKYAQEICKEKGSTQASDQAFYLGESPGESVIQSLAVCWHTAVAGCLMRLTLGHNEFPTSQSQGGHPYVTECRAVTAADLDGTALNRDSCHGCGFFDTAVCLWQWWCGTRMVS